MYHFSPNRRPMRGQSQPISVVVKDEETGEPSTEIQYFPGPLIRNIPWAGNAGYYDSRRPGGRINKIEVEPFPSGESFKFACRAIASPRLPSQQLGFFYGSSSGLSGGSSLSGWGISPYYQFCSFCTQLPKFFTIDTRAIGGIGAYNTGRFLLRRTDGADYPDTPEGLFSLGSGYFPAWTPIWDIDNKVKTESEPIIYLQVLPYRLFDAPGFAVAACWHILIATNGEHDVKTDFRFVPRGGFEVEKNGEYQDSRDYNGSTKFLENPMVRLGLGFSTPPEALPTYATSGDISVEKETEFILTDKDLGGPLTGGETWSDINPPLYHQGGDPVPQIKAVPVIKVKPYYE